MWLIMGKHERQLIEQAEKIVVKIINSQSPTKEDKENPWFNHAQTVAKQIKKDFIKIKKATHLGNRYDNIGDILVESEEGQNFIETKMSISRSGRGTKANLGQNSLTDLNLFAGSVKSWSQFREDKGHNKWVTRFLNVFKEYPAKILLNGDKARYLRKRGAKTGRNILGRIRDKDREEKIEYLDYLNQEKQNYERIKRFLVLVLLGIHKKDEMRTLIDNKKFFEQAKNLIIYYTNHQNGKIVVKRENVGDVVKQILKKYHKFKIIFRKDTTSCILVGLTGSGTKNMLRITFHWKNAAQGVETPCLNIFDIPTLK